MTGPGFYQGLRGRASGRPSPRTPLRAPRREAVFAEHGLMSSGAADPNQGQLWSPEQLGPATPQHVLSRNAGVPAPLPGNAPGFMPGIERSTPQAARRAKVTAVNKLATARVRTGVDRGTGAVRESMEDRQKLYDAGRPADWYQPVSEGRNVMGEGMAHRAIEGAAIRTGTTQAKMIRATAITSPRTAWDEGGAPGTTDYRMPNLRSAEGVVHAVNALHPDAPHEDVVEAARTSQVEAGSSLAEAKAKAGAYHRQSITAPIKVSDPSSQKVPNFEQSLHMSNIDPAVVRGAAGAYTVDKWDVAGIGGDEKLLKNDTGYAVAHMTGVRTALKNRELPPNFQARTWNTSRGLAQPETMGTNRLFVSQRSGKVVPNPNALAPERASTFHALAALDTRTQRRQGTAAKYDLEF